MRARLPLLLLKALVDVCISARTSYCILTLLAGLEFNHIARSQQHGISVQITFGDRGMLKPLLLLHHTWLHDLDRRTHSWDPQFSGGFLYLYVFNVFVNAGVSDQVFQFLGSVRSWTQDGDCGVRFRRGCGAADENAVTSSSCGNDRWLTSFFGETEDSLILLLLRWTTVGCRSRGYNGCCCGRLPILRGEKLPFAGKPSNFAAGDDLLSDFRNHLLDRIIAAGDIYLTEIRFILSLWKLYSIFYNFHARRGNAAGAHARFPTRLHFHLRGRGRAQHLLLRALMFSQRFLKFTAAWFGWFKRVGRVRQPRRLLPSKISTLLSFIFDCLILKFIYKFTAVLVSDFASRIAAVITRINFIGFSWTATNFIPLREWSMGVIIFPHHLQWRAALALLL